MAKPSKTVKSSKPRRPDANTKLLRLLYGDPIIIPHDPEHLEETPLPSESNPWMILILVGGTIAAGLCIWWFAPDFFRRIFLAVGW